MMRQISLLYAKLCHCYYINYIFKKRYIYCEKAFKMRDIIIYTRRQKYRKILYIVKYDLRVKVKHDYITIRYMPIFSCKAV